MTKTARDIINEIGADAICERLGVTSYSVRAAKTAGTFPARWFLGVRALCDERGVECSMSAFNWRSPEPQADSGNGDSPSHLQGGLPE